MYQRSIAILAILAFALGGSGCATNKDYDEILMPLQTGSVLHRRVLVKANHEKKSTKKKKPAAPKPEAETEPGATPTPEEESTPPPDRFR
jgi:hypothetical protein